MPTPKGGYRLDGEKIPSYSQIGSRFQESGGLKVWAFRMGQQNPDASNLWAISRDAIDIGTCTHAMVEKRINGVSEQEIDLFAQDSLIDPDMVDRARLAYGAYCDWAKNFDVKIIAQEIQLVSRKYKYGGTPDAIGIIGNQTCLLDWKTSNAVYSDYIIQLAAYGQLWNENNPENPITGGYHLLRFSKDTGDFAHHYYADLTLELEQFLAFRECYERDKIIKRRAA